MLTGLTADVTVERDSLGVPTIRGANRIDIRHRLHQFRRRARVVLQALPETHRNQIKAYTEGVIAGLTQLRSVPFEYLILRETPRPWHAEDTLLVTYAISSLCAD